jgi:hypothetical protein
MVTPGTQLPSLINVNTPTGPSVINTALPDVLTGKVISIDPIAQTALVTSSIGNPQVINLQGMSPEVGSDLFFNPATNTILGTQTLTAPITQTQPSGLGSLIPPTNTPVETTPPPIVPPVVTPPVNINPIINAEPPKPITPTIPETPTTSVTPTPVPPGEFVFKPVEQEIVKEIVTPVTPTTPTIPTTPKTPSTPSIPFFPTFTSDGTTYVDYGQPEVPPPELYGMFHLPPPEYTKASGPMANVGIMSGATQ